MCLVWILWKHTFIRFDTDMHSARHCTKCQGGAHHKAVRFRGSCQACPPILAHFCKMPRVVVDSKFRATGTQEDYTYKIWTPVKDVRFIRLLGANVPRSTYPITTGYNDQFEYNATSATIPAGNYTGPALATVLSGLTSSTITFDATTGKFLYDGTVTTSFGPFVLTPAVHHVLGWPLSGVTGLTLLGTPATNIAVLNWPDGLFLDVTTNSSYGQSTYSTSTAHTFFVPMSDTMFGEYAAYSEHERYTQVDTVSDKDVQELRITWYPPDDRTPGSNSATAATNFSNARKYFSFNGVDHQLVFDVGE